MANCPALLVGERHEIVGQGRRAEHLRACEGQVGLEHLLDLGLGVRLELEPDIGASFRAEQRTGLVRKLQLAAALDPDLVIGAENLDRVLIGGDEGLHVLRLRLDISGVEGIEQERGFRHAKVVDQVTDLGEHARPAGRDHRRRDGIEHVRGVEGALLEQRTQQRRRTFVDRHVFFGKSVLFVADRHHGDPVQRGACAGADLLALQVADGLDGRILQDHDEVSAPAQKRRDADNRNSRILHAGDIVPAESVAFGGASLHRGDAGRRGSGWNRHELEAVLLVEAELLDGEWNEGVRPRFVVEQPNLAAVAERFGRGPGCSEDDA